LRSCADVWGGCIARILAEDGPRIRAVSPRGWIRKTGYLDLEFEPSLRSYAAQRGDLLAVLEALPRDAWSRAATVTAAGKTHEWTVFTYAQRIAQHEAVHVEQIAKAAGAAPDS
ncbi:MAG TPA: DinB family protein, partial [Micromonosporaceae bacterium]|nr:DinB family protein [Micromonosporaceae bacterium]